MPIPAAPSSARSIHRALDEFVRRFPQRLPDDAEGSCCASAASNSDPILSRPGAWAFWWPRFERIADWLVTRGARPTAPTSSRASANAREAGLAGARRPLHDHRQGRPHRPPRRRRLSAGRLQDRRRAAAESRCRRALRRNCRSKARSCATAASTGSAASPAALEYWRLSGGEPRRRTLPDRCGRPRRTDRSCARPRRGADRSVRRSGAHPISRFRPRVWAPRFSDYRHLERLAESEAEE